MVFFGLFLSHYIQSIIVKEKGPTHKIRQLTIFDNGARRTIFFSVMLNSDISAGLTPSDYCNI